MNTVTVAALGALVTVLACFPLAGTGRSANPSPSHPSLQWYAGPHVAACLWRDGQQDFASIQVNGQHEHFCIAASPIVRLSGPAGTAIYQFAPDSDMGRGGCHLTLRRADQTLRLSDPDNSCACPDDARFAARTLRRTSKPTMRMCQD